MWALASLRYLRSFSISGGSLCTSLSLPIPMSQCSTKPITWIHRITFTEALAQQLHWSWNPLGGVNMFKAHLCCAAWLYLYSLISCPSPPSGATDTLGERGKFKHSWSETWLHVHTQCHVHLCYKLTQASRLTSKSHLPHGGYVLWKAMLQVRRAWLCTRWSWQPQRDWLCHSNVLLPDSWPVWMKGWFASGHATSGDKHADLLAGSGCLEAQGPEWGGCPKSGTCWGSEFNQQPPNHGLNPQLLEEERWLLPCCWCLFDSPSCWRGIDIIVGFR